ncbi:hypothetical protein GCM10023189_39160 [Nibrella saemangeumensis]|uniref:AAA+ ATPase domain-containing protein n=1 Tax=Nibrella saemangeumensis TaxID=1084526 RepID=A0ABP8N721_9BACT
MSLPIQAQHYLELFNLSADAFFHEFDFQPDRIQFFKKFREKSFLETAQWPDFQALRLNLHTFQSLRLAGANALGNPNHSIEHYRSEFIQLLYGEASLATRFDHFQKSVDYFGDATISEILQWCFPDQLISMNDRTIKTIEYLGVSIKYPRGSSKGKRFEVFTESIKPLIQAYLEIVGQRTSTTAYVEFDSFCYWLTMNINNLPLPPKLPSLPPGRRFWLLGAGANGTEWENFLNDKVAAIGWPELGDLRQYDTKEKIREKHIEVYGGETNQRNNALACWQFAHDIKEGDIIVAKKGLYHYLGWGIVTKEYLFDEQASEAYPNRIGVDWKKQGLFSHDPKFQLSMKALTDITRYTDYIQKVMLLLAIELDGSGEVKAKEPHIHDRTYTLSQAFADAHLSEDEFERLIALLERKKQLILQGAPGTGKSYLAKILQRYLTDGIKDQAEVVQFHPSYAYEDFVEGYRPVEGGGATLMSGIFKLFCEKALISQRANDGKKYVLLIDEINRGNLAKIFGELLFLLEYRNERIKLTYRPEEDFHIPENVYLIGTMNTADRSLSLVDYALRRRFSFITLRTDYLLVAQLQVTGFSAEKLAENLKKINLQLATTPSLGESFAIGHSYFVSPRLPSPLTPELLEDIWEFDLQPLLEEYYMDDSAKLSELKSLFFNQL